MDTLDRALVLVVDDEPNILELLSAALRLSGFAVTAADSGAAAVAAARERRPDIVVLDVMLPDLDGFEVANGLISYADLVLDEDAHQVSRAGRPVQLSPTEFNLLRYLMVNAGKVVSKAQILDRVWHYDFGGDGRIVESYISYLRRKIDVTDPQLIHTIRGVGYSLRLPP